jgi:tRNA(Ile)-lysidine synthase
LVDEAGGPAVADRVDEVLALGGHGTKALDLGGGVRAVVEYGVLRIAREAPPAPPRAIALPVPGRVAWAGGEVVAERGPAGLQVRAWRPGDRMRPAGLGGTKSLQDLFTDRKIPRERRARTPVVVCAGEIAWVGGVATAEGFGADVLRLAWHE